MELNLPLFHNYFCKQWLSPPFDKWKVFTTPPSYSKTNSCKPLNAEVKFDKCMGEMIVYYSKNLKKFDLYPSDEKAANDVHI